MKYKIKNEYRRFKETLLFMMVDIIENNSINYVAVAPIFLVSIFLFPIGYYFYCFAPFPDELAESNSEVYKS